MIGGSLAPAAVRRRAFQAREDRAGEDLQLGVLVGRRVSSASSQPSQTSTSSSTNTTSSPVGALDPGVARHVETERPGVGLVARAEALGERASFLGGPGVVHDDQLRPGRVACGAIEASATLR